MSLKLQGLLWAKAKASWGELESLLKLPPAGSFPLPLPSGDLDVYVSAEAAMPAPGEPPGFEFKLEADYELDPDETEPERVLLRGFTLGRSCHLTFTGKLSPPAEGIDPTATIPQLEGTLTVEVAAKFPPLPDLDVLRVRAGDSEGWTKLRLTAQVDTGGHVNLSAWVLGPLEVDVYFPGLPQAGPPPLHLKVDSIGGAVDFDFTRRTFSGAIGGEGEFRFSPQLSAPDLPVVEYLKPMLDGLVLEGSLSVGLSLSLSKEAHENALYEDETPAGEEGEAEEGAAADEPADMTVRASLWLSEENPELCLCCKFNRASVEFNLLELLQRLTRTPEPVEVGAQRGIALGFGLSSLCLCLSRNPSFAIEMVAKAGVEIPAYLKLTTSDVKIGMGRALPARGDEGLKLPLRLPRISREAFGFLKDSPINKTTRRQHGARPLDRAIYELIGKYDGSVVDEHARGDDGGGSKGRYDRFLELYFDVVEQLSGAAPADDKVLIAYQEGDNWRVRPPARPSGFDEFDDIISFNEDLPLRLAAGFVGKREGNRADGALTTTGELAVAYHVKGEQVQGEDVWHLLLARPALEFVNFFFSLSFRNPRDIRVGGSVRFIVDGPLSEIRKFTLTVGLSADMVYFSLDVDEKTKIPLPAYKGDQGGSLAIGKLMFGFGYLKRSLAVAFAGELVFPEKLVDDLDTSDELGAGLRLPVQSKLAFQFDLMPIVVNQVVIPVPLFQFNWDLRKDVSPGLRDTRTCEPFWDGLQLVVPDIIRLSLKRISYSPLVFTHASSNSDFDGDLMLGDARNGLTIVADNIYWIYGIDSMASVVFAPILAHPFCDNFCIDLRLGGFGVHFNLQRPIPSLSPLAVFEILALIADPLYEIAPRGELADTVRVSLSDARITLPEAARRLFPQAEAWLPKPLNVTINLATFLTLFQRVVKTIKPVGEAILDALRSGGRIADELQRKAAELQSTDVRTIALDMLASLPPELRKLRLAASFAGFDAGAVLVLTDHKGALSAMRGEGGAVSAAPQFMTNPNIRRAPGAPRMFDAGGAGANLLDGSEFSGFEDTDLDDVPPPPSDALLDVIDVTAALANRLKTDDRLITRFLREQFSPGLQAMLEEYAGGLLPDVLARRLVGELNRILKGESIYKAERFETEPEPPLAKLIERQRDGLLQPQEMTRLNRMLLEAAYPDELPASVGVLIGARVRVFGGQRFRFIGYVYADGAFSLVSEAKVDPLELSVAGIPARLPLAVEGRLRLAGRAKRDGIIGSVRAEGRADWAVVPGVLNIGIGSRRHPAALELFGDGRFAFNASASVVFFNNPGCLMKAEVSVSHAHCFLSGSLKLKFGTVANKSLFDFEAEAEGRVGPGEQFRISFAAEQKKGGPTPGDFCGFPVASLKGTLSESGAEIEARLVQGEGELMTWPGGVNFTPQCRITEALLKGWVNPRKTTKPDFGLEGAITLQLFGDTGPNISGRGGIFSRDERLAAFVEGTLTWQGRDWLGGRVELNPDSVKVSGEASFALDLVPTSLPGEIKVAGLFFKLTIGGSFTLDASAALAEFDIKVDWLLAARLTGAGDQILPLASQSFSKTDSANLQVHLATISGFKLVPTAVNVDVPIPNVTQRGYNLRVDNYTVLNVPVPIVEHNGFYMPGKPPGYTPPHERDPPESWPIEMPTLDLDLEHPGRVSLNFNLDANFTATLEWAENKLWLKIENGPQVTRVPLEQAFPPES